jgi:molecular chaperone DnaK
MPMVARMLEEAAGKPPDRSLSADEAVARGAAVYAYLSAADSSVRVVNVNAHSLRLVGRDRDLRRVAYPMIAKNTDLPASTTKLFPVTKPGQVGVRLEICEGESDDPNLCESIGHVRIEGLPETADKRWQVAVRLKFNTDGTVAVKASVRDPDRLDTEVKRVKAVLEPSRGWSPEELAEARRLLDTFEIP